VEVNAFRQNFGSDQDAEVVLRVKRPSIKIGHDIFAHGLERCAREEQSFLFDFGANFLSQVVRCLFRLGKNYELAAF
jgi:hypothetical protein